MKRIWEKNKKYTHTHTHTHVSESLSFTPETQYCKSTLIGGKKKKQTLLLYWADGQGNTDYLDSR